MRIEGLKMKIMTIVYLCVALITSMQADIKEWYKPTLSTTWHWQLNGEINMNRDVDVYIVDLFDTSTTKIEKLQRKGKRVIAYFSAGSYEAWREDASFFSKSDLGEKMDGWDERWIDITSENVRAIMSNRLKLARLKGFDGVEADNVDGYQNKTGFKLTFIQQLEFNIFLANEAHEEGLAIALKNDLDQIVALEPYFDFLINEECHLYDECEMCLPFIKTGKPVFNAEYQKKKYKKICKKSKKLGLSTLVLPLELDDSFRLECP